MKVNQQLPGSQEVNLQTMLYKTTHTVLSYRFWSKDLYVSPAAVWSGGVYPVSVGAGSLGFARRLARSHRHPPGRGPRPRLLAERAAEHRLLWAAVPAPAERPQRVHTAALGLLLRSASHSPHTHRFFFFLLPVISRSNSLMSCQYGRVAHFLFQLWGCCELIVPVSFTKDLTDVTDEFR